MNRNYHGLGREGIRFAMEDMTEIRNLVIRTPDDVRIQSNSEIRKVAEEREQYASI